MTQELLGAIRSLARPLHSPADLDPLVERIGDARYVLLGEASHGTHEYYTWRAALSRRLIEERDFTFLAVEGDWPDCYGVNEFIKGVSAAESARDVLHHFERWPTWLWANEEVLELVEWLRRHNAGRPHRPVGFYGLDVYSLWDSLYQVLGYLGKHHASALPAARRAFQCFEPFGEDVQKYAQATRWLDESCAEEVVALLAEVRRTAAGQDAHEGLEARFNAEQNALVVRNAERYYRTMVRGGPDSWNLRDRHMVETLERLMQRHGPNAKAIVWEHNTHIGDARFTDMTDDGLLNVGQLVRERHEAEEVVLVGFGSYRGQVIAGREWEAPLERMDMPPGRRDSWEDVLHRAVSSDALLWLVESRENRELLQERGHRAIGVVYRPAREHRGNYVPTVLPRRYDVFLFLDETLALRPLAEVQPHAEGDVPETYPSGV